MKIISLEIYLILIFLSVISCGCKNEQIPTVLTAEITNVTANSATGGGEISDEGSGIVIARGVCWSDTKLPTINDNRTSDGTGVGSFISTISGLTKGTKYTLRSYASNTAGTSYGEEKTFTTLMSDPLLGAQIIADHTIVGDFNKIPASYMNEAKKMMVCFAGASHSAAYRIGMTALESLYPAYSSNVATGEAYTDQHVRVNSIGYDMHEDEWYTWFAYSIGSRPSASSVVKNMIKEYYDHGHPIHVIGFGWCWTMSASYLSLTRDPVYNVKWYGTSHGGPGDNTHGFGLDDGDFSVTGNPVSLDTYLNAVQDYNEYCKTNGYPTKVIFTTGPVDYYKGEQGYQAYLKHEHIRSFVKADPTRILFDYADILCYDENGNRNTESWTFNGVTYTYPFITATNLGEANLGHIGIEGAIRLAKAEWWLLARIAGWDGQ